MAALVSNNQYRLRPGVGSGTRPRLDHGRLGIAVVNQSSDGGGDGSRRARLRMERWTDRRFRIEAQEPVPAGIDGEAVVLDPPLRFRSLRGVLRVRIAPAHPGASPSAGVPEAPAEAIAALLRLALVQG